MSTLISLPTIILLPTKKSFNTALDLLNKLIKQSKTDIPLSEDDSSRFAGSQESLFECASHASNSGTCRCPHHRVAYSFGEISESYYYKDIDNMLPFLIKTRAILKRLIVKNAGKAGCRSKGKAGCRSKGKAGCRSKGKAGIAKAP